MNKSFVISLAILVEVMAALSAFAQDPPSSAITSQTQEIAALQSEAVLHQKRVKQGVYASLAVAAVTMGSVLASDEYRIRGLEFMNGRLLSIANALDRVSKISSVALYAPVAYLAWNSVQVYRDQSKICDAKLAEAKMIHITTSIGRSNVIMRPRSSADVPN